MKKHAMIFLSLFVLTGSLALADSAMELVPYGNFYEFDEEAKSDKLVYRRMRVGSVCGVRFTCKIDVTGYEWQPMGSKYLRQVPGGNCLPTPGPSLDLQIGITEVGTTSGLPDCGYGWYYYP